ncbi:hypothetical protein BC835DRAFT_823534 [Cytidiella melzeri]|nr:hypothetical protein BC835DRAFT_823534 [Cytidiella melzeri]
MFQNLAMHLKAWAASNAHAESCIPQYPQPPPQHSRGRVAAGVMAPAPAKQESQLESSERVPRPAQEIPRPAAHKNRWLKEAVYFNDEDFAYGVFFLHAIYLSNARHHHTSSTMHQHPRSIIEVSRLLVSRSTLDSFAPFSDFFRSLPLLSLAIEDERR